MDDDCYEDNCEDCRRLRQLTREGKARTFSISVDGVFQAVPGTENEVWDKVFGEFVHCFGGGWRITELGDDDQMEYEDEDVAA